MKGREVRAKSWSIAEKLGYPINENLPLIGLNPVLRKTEDIVGRMLAMNIVMATAYGFKPELALERLGESNSMNCLTTSESRFIRGGEGDAEEIKQEVEALWALGYVVGLTDELDPSTYCGSTFVRMFPDLRSGNGVGTFRTRCVLRPVAEIFQMLDLWYCLHWGMRDAQMRSTPLPGRVRPYVIEQRRRALEWCCSDQTWEDISLDT